MCLTTPATVIRVSERGGITVVAVHSADDGERECLTYVYDLEPGDHVLVAGGAVVERLDEDPETTSLAALFIEAYDATHTPGGTIR